MKRILTLSLLLTLTVAAFAQSQNTKRYGVKSGILKTVTTTGDQKSYDTHWFDDYGYKAKTTTKMNMGELGDYEATILLIGTDMWAIGQDGRGKKGQGNFNRNWRALTDKEIKDFEIKDLGTEEYKGKKCQVFQYREKQLLTKVTVTVWVWEGIIIRQHIKKKMSESWTELESLQLNAKIPAGTFAIPKDAD